MSKDVNVMFWAILAIDCRAVLKIKYDGGGERKIEPYVIGENDMKEVMLRAFDLSKNDWRIFKADKITSIEKTSITFKGFRPGYNTGKDPVMKKILRRVK